MGFLPYSQYQEWIPFYSMGLRSQERAVGFPLYIRASITQLDMACLMGWYCCSQSLQLSQTIDIFSPLATCKASSDNLKASQQGGSF